MSFVVVTYDFYCPSFDPSFWELTIYKDSPNTVTSVPNSAYTEPPSPYVLIAQFDRSDAIFGREKQNCGEFRLIIDDCAR